MIRPTYVPASPSQEALLLEAMAAIARKGVRLGCRTIRKGDEAYLLPEEARSIPARHPAMRRASGAARRIAHGLLADLGMNDFAVLRTSAGAPTWPDGTTGSLAHDEEMAVAAVAPVSCICSLGIDVEPAKPLPDDIFPLVAVGADVTDAVDRRLVGHLGYEDIVADLNAGHAMTKTARRTRLVYCATPRIVVLAFVPS